MKRSAYRWLASASLLLAATASLAATRPRYGGVLRVETVERLESLDTAGDTRDRVAALLADRLIELNEAGEPQAWLAKTWQHSPDYKRWQFWMRSGIRLHDGSPLLASDVAAALSAANSTLRVQALADSVVIESDAPRPSMLAELSRNRYSILCRREGGAVLGTGAFRLEQFTPNQRITLRANDDYWAGRPYLDSVQIELARTLAQQAIDLDLGRTDLIQAAPAARNEKPGRKSLASAPNELIAIVFTRGRSASDNTALRQALALAIDRASIYNVLLQRQGEPATALLPQWCSGYAFLFSSQRDAQLARQVRAASPAPSELTISVSADPLLRSIAERLAVNARDAGLLVHVSVEGATTSAAADARLVRVPLSSSDPDAALAAVLGALNYTDLPTVISASAPGQRYAAERAALQDWRIIPVVHVPQVFTAAPQVHNLVVSRDGSLNLADVFLEVK